MSEEISAIKERLDAVRAKIRESEKNCGREEGSVKLLAVSKFHPKDAVLEAMKCGQTAFGENRVQEAAEKFAGLSGAEVHIIGHLQRNKVKKALEAASVIESLDSLALLEEIEKQCARLEKTVRVFLELHTGALDFCAAGGAPHVVPAGFMTMAPLSADESAVRTAFRTLRESAERLRQEFPQFPLTELSMGMSGDYALAIAEGSTEVRIGTAIFGERHYE